MRVVLINYGHHADLGSAAALLDRYRTLTGWAQGLTAAGAQVVVVQGFRHDEMIRRDGIEYEFVAGRFVPQLARWRIPYRLHRRIRAHQPDIVHLNDVRYPVQARALRRSLPEHCVLVMQHHAGNPSTGAVGMVQRWGLGVVDGFIFTGLETAEPWRKNGMIRPRQRILPIMEGSSHFRMMERENARAVTGLKGDPVFFWAGHLNSNKDPLTVLDGFAGALNEHPGARLYMAFVGEELLSRVRARIRADSTLAQAVELLGAIAYGQIELYFNSADYFVLGSHHEGSGYALVDALACGVVPIVTDIPSYRFMTDDGAFGALWPCGDAAALTAAIGKVLSCSLEAERRAVRAFFERHLSFAAIGRAAYSGFAELIQHRRSIL